MVQLQMMWFKKLQWITFDANSEWTLSNVLGISL